jgi:hypothetical protein
VGADRQGQRAARRRGPVAHGFSRATLIVTVLAAAVLVWLLLPPAPVALPDGARDPRVVAGAIHVHTTRSDGGGTIDDVAAAAAGAGLQFVILSDHGDGTQEPEPPAYRSGVLVIDGVEISTTGGHYVAAGMRRAPYPLGGEPADVVEDVRRLGGLGIVAHADSPKPELAWHDWDAPFDGVEWLNADAQWREEPWSALARAGLAYLFRPAAAIALTLDRPEPLLARLDRLSLGRDIVWIAGADAHARLGAEGKRGIRLPSYRNVFRTFSTRVMLRGAWRGEPRRDAELILDALRAGRTFTAIDAIARPARLTFTAESGGVRVEIGGRLAAARGRVTLRVRADAPGGASIVLLKEGRPVATGAEAAVQYTAPPDPAVYRVEVHVPDAPGVPAVPWIVSSPIAIGPLAARAAARPVETARVILLERGDRSHWTAEQDPTSHADVAAAPGGEGERALELSYSLGANDAASPYAALVRELPYGLSQCRAVVLTGAADREMRVSVQLREPGGETPRLGRRWRRSVYLSPRPRTVAIPLEEMRPLPGSPVRPTPETVRSLLVVVDTVNARPAAHGIVRLFRVGCS